MALFDFLKRKKEIAASREPRQRREKAKQGKKIEKKPAQVLRSPEDEGDQKPAVAKSFGLAKKTSGFSFEAIDKPHISEKATHLMEKNQYIFKVPSGYNKNEIKKAVEGVYGVNVLSVNVIKIPPKKRRIGGTQGFKKGLVKAIVKIKEGQKIEIL